ncbi:MAG: anti-sigma factor [Nostocaceae cyanobacterium]|nr:anti-sigma factor [Nostocaceae cyanobacterium]
MVDSSDFQKRQELLASYVLGDLTPEEVAQVNELLAQQPELAQEVQRLQETLALLPFALPENEPPEALGSQILQAATGTSPAISTINTVNRVPNRQKPWLGVLGSVAAVFVVVLGLYSYRLQQEVVTATEELSRYHEAIALLRQPNNRLLTLKGINTTSNASGSFVIVPKSGKAVLSLQNLNPLPQGKVYRLWAVTSGKKIDCGDFQTDTTGKVFVQLPVDNSMGTISEAFVTIEPSQPVAQPTGETVMRGTVSL